MELWLLRSLSHELFSFFTMELWYQEAFHMNFFLFSRWNSGYQEAFLTNFFLFSRWNSRDARFGGKLFSHIYITKSIYIGSASLKTLPLSLEPPLQGKEYGPPYSNATKKIKAIVFSRNHL
jgi:hypothetical protein